VRRHFVGLFLLIVATLAAVSWVEDRLFPDRSLGNAEEATLRAATELLRSMPSERWRESVAQARRAGVALDLLSNDDLAGADLAARLARGEMVHMLAAGGENWSLARLDDTHVLSLRTHADRRAPSEWVLTALFYAVIACALMLWIWPLARDLRALETAAAQYGHRNWAFTMDIKRHSQIHRVAQTFRRMAMRINQLIGSHQDMANALSHEIKTPLSRMQFELEFAQHSEELPAIRRSLEHIKDDVLAIDKLITATLDYAILERADVELNLAPQDFTVVLPSIAAAVLRDTRPGLSIESLVDPEARTVMCDMHLLETALKNLLYNACRYARNTIRVRFLVAGERNLLSVEDDGPGIPEPDWQRVFDSFVKLDRTQANRAGYGLGLAIVKRMLEWHEGEAVLSRSELGGARFALSWPVTLRRRE
jgi:two-component system OmpR family sensor kinase